jgi:hypothetical protein
MSGVTLRGRPSRPRTALDLHPSALYVNARRQGPPVQSTNRSADTVGRAVRSAGRRPAEVEVVVPADRNTRAWNNKGAGLFV